MTHFPSLDWTLAPDGVLTVTVTTYKPLAASQDAVAVARALIEGSPILLRFTGHDWSQATVRVNLLGTEYVVVVPRRAPLTFIETPQAPPYAPGEKVYGREAYEPQEKPRDLIGAMNYAFEKMLGPSR